MNGYLSGSMSSRYFCREERVRALQLPRLSFGSCRHWSRIVDAASLEEDAGGMLVFPKDSVSGGGSRNGMSTPIRSVVVADETEMASGAFAAFGNGGDDPAFSRLRFLLAAEEESGGTGAVDKKAGFVGDRISTRDANVIAAGTQPGAIASDVANG